MRKKFINYIIKETNYRDVNTILEPTLEECYFLYDKKISTIKTQTKFTFDPVNYIEIFDIFEFHREN